MQVAQGDLAGALKSFQDSLAIRDKLAKSDPGHAGWQRDLAVSYEKIGDVQKAQGDLAGALKSFPTASPSESRLVAAVAIAGNARRQHDLSVRFASLASDRQCPTAPRLSLVHGAKLAPCRQPFNPGGKEVRG